MKAKTGGQTLDVRPADPRRLTDVVAVIESLARAKAEIGSVSVSVPVTDRGVLAEVVHRLDEEGIEVAELALRSASLDEVFLSLTGHPAEELPTEEDA